ncbi:MAG: T9SS type A sorting domain-containing protein [Bacteroidetes bacterium]|nr:T9SS type A sorting domain-containing protein [Bacteroidota bacterium]
MFLLCIYGQFNIKITDIDSKYLSVQLVDITGKLVKNLFEETQNDLSNVEIMVQKSNLAAGVYFIVTNTDKNSLTKKLIIE